MVGGMDEALFQCRAVSCKPAGGESVLLLRGRSVLCCGLGELFRDLHLTLCSQIVLSQGDVWCIDGEKRTQAWGEKKSNRNARKPQALKVLK